ncbi:MULTISPECIES: heat-inducible transcriptional repressor HrcA [unclassified Virgibacillus]|uniref:heat-inducible transcriptional repressor HrcA n=1 Tax=unclassified Virgibacillus TaxID=2620237 RepID=UPI0024DE7306|nr:heat-inducible transcriptional repressor HrcA [Virgibacillus sp. LDC-1]
MLTERQLLILQVIIDDFIESAHPVGSRVISKKGNIPYSAATIRNEMADLEEMGYLEKTHTSSGRIPSEKGYRYYVDYVIAPTLKKTNLHIMKHIVQDGFLEMEQVVQKAAEILSDITNYTSIILGPEIFNTKLKQLQIIPLSHRSAVAILITDAGHVEHRTFTVPAQMQASDLEKMINILNSRLQGVPMLRLQHVLHSEIMALLNKYVNDVEIAYDYLSSVFFSDQPVKLYIGGKSNILMQPEFNNVEKIRSFYSMMENEDEVADLIKSSQNGIKVTIGNENKLEAIKDLSLITASYDIGENQMGTIALIGPTRMEYRKVITLMNALSEEMTQALHHWYQDKE